jgi:hypothetical protein
VPQSAITSDIGVSPVAGGAMTGFTFTRHSSGEYSTSSQINGKAFAVDYATPTPEKLATAILDMQAAYLDAEGRPSPEKKRRR